MAPPVVKPEWNIYGRIAIGESTYGTLAPTADWNIANGGGATGWRDLAINRDVILMQPNPNNIFSTYAAGKRGMNQVAPVEGAYSSPGELPMIFVSELVDPLFEMLMGTVVRTPTAGAAALASTVFASVATLDTQSDGTEMLLFTVSSSTAASSAQINIIQNAVTVETIDIGTSASSVDGPYYSKGAYDGSTNAITFSVSGTVTAGTVVISGVDLSTNVFTLTNNAPVSGKLEEGGLPRSGSNSNYYNGLIIPQMTISFDRTANDGMVAVTCPVESQFPAAATAGTYGNDLALYYKNSMMQGWTASITKGGSAFEKLQGFSITIDPKNTLFAVSSGNQNPSGAFSGGMEVTATLDILPEDATEWNVINGQTVGDYELTLTSPANIVDTTPWTTKFELTQSHFESYDPTIADGILGASVGLRTLDDASDGSIKITNVCRMPV